MPQTGLPELDEVLKSSHFFDTASFPTASFKSKMVQRGITPARLKVTADLSLHGITQPVSLDVNSTLSCRKWVTAYESAAYQIYLQEEAAKQK